MKRPFPASALFVGAHLAAAALVAATAFVSAPAFASGYGPLPSYEPLAGAPASQRGPGSTSSAMAMRTASIDADAHGGMPDTRSESGGPVRMDHGPSLYLHR